MDRHLHLLAEPDIRPLRDVHTWLLDGWRLIRRFPVLWIAYSGICFGLIFLMEPIISALELSLLGLLYMLFWACFFFVLQSGAYRLMGSRIDGGEKPRLREMFRLPGENARKAFLRCLLFLVVLHGALFSSYIFLIITSFHFYTPSYTWPMRLITPFITVGMPFMVFSISWAILPILGVFPETGFATLLRLQLCGTLRNWRPFCYFILLVGGLFFLLFYLVGLAGTYFSFKPPVVGIFALLWPLTFAWRFSAARHIFMVAE